MRLLPGVLAGQTGEFVLDGDASIRRRPMGRIAGPLAEMGVALETTDGCPPVRMEVTASRRADHLPAARSPRPR